MAKRRDSNPPSTTAHAGNPDEEPRRMSALIPLAWFAIVIVGAICCEFATRQ